SRVVCSKVVFLCVEVRGISSTFSRLCFKSSLSLAGYRSLRDAHSTNVLEEMGVRQESHVFPDLVFSLPVGNVPAAASNGQRRIVGLNPIPYFNGTYWHEGNQAIYNRYVEVMAALGLWLLQKDYDVVFFPTQFLMDPPVI